MGKKLLRIRLRLLRNEQKLTIEEVAKKMDLTPAAIKNYELGLRVPSIDNIEKLAKIYKCNPAYLFGWIK